MLSEGSWTASDSGFAQEEERPSPQRVERDDPLHRVRGSLQELCRCAAQPKSAARERALRSGLEHARRHLRAYHGTLERRWSKRASASSNFHLLQRHVEHCCRAQQSQLESWLREMTDGGDADGCVRKVWAGAMAMQVELDQLDHDAHRLLD